MTGPAASILVVDDSASKRYVISSWLRRGGFEIVEAETGAEALVRLTEVKVELVVLDVRLPDMSGFAVCEQIKRSPEYGMTPVIHVSAAAVDTVNRARGLAGGADAYLVEPIDPEELLATVNAILRHHRARQKAERVAARLSTLTRLSLRLNRSQTLGGLLTEAAAGAARIFGTPSVVGALDANGGWLAAWVDGPDAPATVSHWTPPENLPVAGTYGDIAAEAVGLVRWPPGDMVRVVAVSQRLDRGPTYVMVPTGTADPGSPVLTLLAQSVAGTIEAQRAYAIEHDLALTLQRSLLPRRLPRIDGIDLAVRYVPASDTAEIGGDFYDLTQFEDQLVVTVGDVGGHSLHAATVMAELRHATRAYVAEGHAPAEVIDRLRLFVRRLLPDEVATMCLLTMDTRTGRVRLANAGHPAPLMIVGREVTQITERSPLLGLAAPGAKEVELDVPDGAALLLYTDGLVERREEHIDLGTGRLVAAAADPDADLDVYCDRLVASVAAEQPADDIAVVALRRRHAPRS
jgi:CheY-like chemotaxis protein